MLKDWGLILLVQNGRNWKERGASPPAFLGVAVASVLRGKAVVISEENESMMIKLVFGAGWSWDVREKRAIRWASVGVENCVSLSRKSDELRGSVEDCGIIG